MLVVIVKKVTELIQTRTPAPVIGLMLLVVLPLPGCHRGFYRRQADAEAVRLVREKSCDPRWNSSSGDISVDPQSRMFDPFSQDHPPMPPDDETSHQLMHEVDCRPGYPHWHANGDTCHVENPEWLARLPMNEDGVLVLNLERAVDLAFLHSPEYQSQKETLYLSALDVSLERFGFDGQVNFGRNAFFETQGRLASGGSVSQFSTALGANSEGVNWRKLGITGTNFAVGLANSVLWNFAGPNDQSASSLINFSIIQPLLRNAGRSRILEALTQSERTLLANIRQLDRFRRGFYMQVAVGRSPGRGPLRGGSFLGAPQGASGAGGLVGLLQARQEIRNQEFAVRQTKNVLNQIRELFASDQIDSLQKVQVESQLYSSQQTLLSLRRNYQDQLDDFKRTLGLPPQIPVVIEDAFLDQFELIDDQITDRQVELETLRARTGDALIRLGEILPLEKPLTVAELEALDASLRERKTAAIRAEGKQDFASHPDLPKAVADLLPFVDEALEMLSEVREADRELVRADFAKLKGVREERIEYLKDLRQKVLSRELGEMSEIDPSLLDPGSVASLENYRDDRGEEKMGLADQLEQTVRRVEKTELALKKARDLIRQFQEARPMMSDAQLFDFLKEQVLLSIPKQLTDLYNSVLEISLIQAQARSNSITLHSIDLEPSEALEIARCMRLDWMNARASLVDAWRQIEFDADQLESQFDLVLEGGFGSFGDSPFSFRSQAGTLRGGFRFDSPLVRQAERNVWRQTLIEYQQARRDFYLFEDEVSRNLRSSIRGINLNRTLFELNRLSVLAQVDQVEQARLKLEEPGRIQSGGGRTTLGNTVAQDLLRAIQQLLDSQNTYLQTWVDYEVARRNLDFDLGTMLLDESGQWIDPGRIDDTIGHRAAAVLGLDPTCLDDALERAAQNDFESPGRPAQP